MTPALAHVLELRRAGDLEAAFAAVLAARADAPTDLELALCHAQLLAERHEDEAAVELFERCSLSVPVEKRARIYSALGVLYDALGREDDAIEACRAALAIEPELVPPASILGLLLGKRQQVDEALVMLRRARRNAKPARHANLDAAIGQLEAYIAKRDAAG